MLKNTAVWASMLLVGLLTFSFPISAYESLTPGVPLDTTLSPARYKNFELAVPECTSDVIVEIFDGRGDLDLFLRYGAPLDADSYMGMKAQSDAYADTLDWADEYIWLMAEPGQPIDAGSWYIAPVNWNSSTAYFYLLADLFTGMPVPDNQVAYTGYMPIDQPILSTIAEEAKPIGLGSVATGGKKLTCRIGLCPFTEPVDIYLALWASILPNELFVLRADGILVPISQSGLMPWKTNVTAKTDETPLGQDIPLSALPPGSYVVYLAVTTAGSLEKFIVWTTTFEGLGQAVPSNIEPYLDIVVDDRVIDFGRLDNKRRNLGVGPNLGVLPFFPIPFQATTTPSTSIPNLCTYSQGQSYLKTLPLLPTIDSNHLNPDQYPDGMTCVYAIVADADQDALNAGFVLPSPMFGEGNFYTAIPIPGGIAAGTLIDTDTTMTAYNNLLVGYANAGLLSAQPHFRAGNSPLTGMTAPVEPLRTPPQEFPYVIAFANGSDPSGIGINAGQIITEAPNPQDPLSLTPSGTVFRVILKEGSWKNGNARGYLWMIPVTNDFWDLRHSNNTGVPALYRGGTQIAEVAYVAQLLPVIWEAPDDPNAAGTVHDRRHEDPNALPRGGTVQLEARIRDGVNAEIKDFELVAYPDAADADVKLKKTVYAGHDDGASCAGAEIVTGSDGDQITYCFEVTNTGSTFLNQINITDNDLNITQNNLQLVVGNLPLAPGASLVYYFETTIQGDLVNTAQVSANPCNADGFDIAEMNNVTDSDFATVNVRTGTVYCMIDLKLIRTTEAQYPWEDEPSVHTGMWQAKWHALGEFAGKTYTGSIDPSRHGDTNTSGHMSVILDEGSTHVTAFNTSATTLDPPWTSSWGVSGQNIPIVNETPGVSFEAKASGASMCSLNAIAASASSTNSLNGYWDRLIEGECSSETHVIVKCRYID